MTVTWTGNGSDNVLAAVIPSWLPDRGRHQTAAEPRLKHGQRTSTLVRRQGPQHPRNVVVVKVVA